MKPQFSTRPMTGAALLATALALPLSAGAQFAKPEMRSSTASRRCS